MEKKIRNKLRLKKEVILFFIVIIVLIFGLIVKLLKNKSYEVEYKINDYNIIENYNKKEKLYTFVIKNKKVNYTFYSEEKYSKKHKLINDIEEINLEDEHCLIIKSDVIENNPLCYNSIEEIDFRLTSEEMQEQLGYNNNLKNEEKEHNNLKVYNTLDYTFLFWNYKGFDVINENINSISISSTDQYEIPLCVKLNEYILIPDYDDKYTFKKFYIYNILKGTKDEMIIDYEISYDSYIIGTHDKSVYLVDKVNKVEYEIVPHKQKIRIVGTSYKRGTIYTEKGFESISIDKLINEEHKFVDNNKYKYKIENEYLYQYTENSKLKISNQKINDIISIENDTVLYLVEDNLYLYNIKYGEIKIANNFEWNFNYKNLIFVYIP